MSLTLSGWLSFLYLLGIGACIGRNILSTCSGTCVGTALERLGLFVGVGAGVRVCGVVFVVSKLPSVGVITDVCIFDCSSSFVVDFPFSAGSHSALSATVETLLFSLRTISSPPSTLSGISSKFSGTILTKSRDVLPEPIFCGVGWGETGRVTFTMCILFSLLINRADIT